MQKNAPITIARPACRLPINVKHTQQDAIVRMGAAQNLDRIMRHEDVSFTESHSMGKSGVNRRSMPEPRNKIGQNVANANALQTR